VPIIPATKKAKVRGPRSEVTTAQVQNHIWKKQTEKTRDMAQVVKQDQGPEFNLQCHRTKWKNPALTTFRETLEAEFGVFILQINSEKINSFFYLESW
jgi:hypothetical protein